MMFWGILFSAGYEEFLVSIWLDDHLEVAKWNERADHNSDSGPSLAFGGLYSDFVLKKMYSVHIVSLLLFLGVVGARWCVSTLLMLSEYITRIHVAWAILSFSIGCCCSLLVKF